MTDWQVTTGSIVQSVHEEMRAVVPGSSGNYAALTFRYRGDSDTLSYLASGAVRRQIGLKLRAQDGCNLIYVMWRQDMAVLEVQTKINPGLSTNEQCGTSGYTKLSPLQPALVLPQMVVGAVHNLAAGIVAGELWCQLDGVAAWRGLLPANALALQGPAGMRSDNVSFDVLGFGT